MKKIGYAAVTLATLLLPLAAHAQYPGTNGVVFYVSTANSTYSIAAMQSNGTGSEVIYSLTPAQNATGNIAGLVASKDGTKLAYNYAQDSVSTNTAGTDCIFVLNADGSNAKSLSDTCSATGSSNDDSSPVFSPDGSTIYFYSDGRSGGAGIYKIPASGGLATQLVTLPNDGSGTFPDSLSISPDGLTLAFPYHTSSEADNRIYTVPTAGGAFSELSASVTGIFGVYDYSPDGTKLLALTFNGTSETLQSVSATTGALIATIDNTNGLMGEGKWSPDGTKVMYTVASGIVGPYNLWTANSDGSGTPVALTSNGTSASPAWTSLTTLPTALNPIPTQPSAAVVSPPSPALPGLPKAAAAFGSSFNPIAILAATILSFLLYRRKIRLSS